jgi:hypothetical protein
MEFIALGKNQMSKQELANKFLEAMQDQTDPGGDICIPYEDMAWILVDLIPPSIFKEASDE